MYATEDHAITIKFTRKLLREREALRAEMNVLILANPFPMSFVLAPCA